MMNNCLPFRLGFVLNPFAGIGGPSANKGSDDTVIQQAAQRGDIALSASSRALTFFRHLQQSKPQSRELVVVTVAGVMGQSTLDEVGSDISYQCVGVPSSLPTSAKDTEHAVQSIVEAGVDLLVFVGGDGTARDVCKALSAPQPVLGVPAGVKMHSGVYAINPQMAAEVVTQLMSGALVNVALQEVRDIDEKAFRQGSVKSRFFGEMWVPQETRFIQQVKQGGFEVEELVLMDIADHLQRHLEPHTLLIMGPGSTTLTIQKSWGIEGTLLGVDLIRDRQIIAMDADAQTVNRCVNDHQGPVLLVVTAIGGQGHIIGRGNQQINADMLQRIGRSQLRVVATKTKLQSLQQRPLVMDSGNPALDSAWQGYIPVITGYEDVVLYPLGYFNDD